MTDYDFKDSKKQRQPNTNLSRFSDQDNSYYNNAEIAMNKIKKGKFDHQSRTKQLQEKLNKNQQEQQRIINEKKDQLEFQKEYDNDKKYQVLGEQQEDIEKQVHLLKRQQMIISMMKQKQISNFSEKEQKFNKNLRGIKKDSYFFDLKDQFQDLNMINSKAELMELNRLKDINKENKEEKEQFEEKIKFKLGDDFVKEFHPNQQLLQMAIERAKDAELVLKYLKPEYRFITMRNFLDYLQQCKSETEQVQIINDIHQDAEIFYSHLTEFINQQEQTIYLQKEEEAREQRLKVYSENHQDSLFADFGDVVQQNIDQFNERINQIESKIKNKFEVFNILINNETNLKSDEILTTEQQIDHTDNYYQDFKHKANQLRKVVTKLNKNKFNNKWDKSERVIKDKIKKDKEEMERKFQKNHEIFKKIEQTVINTKSQKYKDVQSKLNLNKKSQQNTSRVDTSDSSQINPLKLENRQDSYDSSAPLSKRILSHNVSTQETEAKRRSIQESVFKPKTKKNKSRHQTEGSHSESYQADTRIPSLPNLQHLQHLGNPKRDDKYMNNSPFLTENTILETEEAGDNQKEDSKWLSQSQFFTKSSQLPQRKRDLLIDIPEYISKSTIKQHRSEHKTHSPQFSNKNPISQKIGTPLTQRNSSKSKILPKIKIDNQPHVENEYQIKPIMNTPKNNMSSSMNRSKTHRVSVSENKLELQRSKNKYINVVRQISNYNKVKSFEDRYLENMQKSLSQNINQLLVKHDIDQSDDHKFRYLMDYKEKSQYLKTLLQNQTRVQKQIKFKTKK